MNKKRKEISTLEALRIVSFVGLLGSFLSIGTFIIYFKLYSDIWISLFISGFISSTIGGIIMCMIIWLVKKLLVKLRLIKPASASECARCCG